MFFPKAETNKYPSPSTIYEPAKIKGQIYSFILFQSFLESIKNPNIVLDVNPRLNNEEDNDKTESFLEGRL